MPYQITITEIFDYEGKKVEDVIENVLVNDECIGDILSIVNENNYNPEDEEED